MLELKVETVLRVFIPSEEQLKLFPLDILFFLFRTNTPVPKKKKIRQLLTKNILFKLFDHE